MRIINLTRNKTTVEQAGDGVKEPNNKDKVINLLSFDQIPTNKEIYLRAHELAKIADNAEGAMIKEPSWLMGALETELLDLMIKPLYSFTKLVENNICMHTGFVGPYQPDKLFWPKGQNTVVCARCGEVDNVYNFQHTDTFGLFHCNTCDKEFKVWW
uniref:Putative transposase n=1 Tax=viral metagenome TaxID=1070528 RepID=A0A6M3MDN1_9ZZZZ